MLNDREPRVHLDAPKPATLTVDGTTTFRVEDVATQQAKARGRSGDRLVGAKLYPDTRVLARLAASDAPIMSSVLSSTVTRQVFPQAGQ